MRKQTIQPVDIIEAAIKLAAESGFENLATKKVATSCGVSEGSLFHYFSTKQELLEKCLLHIDASINEVFASVTFDPDKKAASNKAIWHAYFNHLLEHVNYTKFYQSFRHSAYYTADVVKSQQRSIPLLKALEQNSAGKESIRNRILWVYLTEASLGFAMQIINGMLPNDEEHIEMIYTLLVEGVYAYLGE